MTFLETDEQTALREVTRHFFEARSPEVVVRQQMLTEQGYDPALWREMAQQLGVPGTAIPEVYGGAGLGYRELGIVMEELGRQLVCAPFYSTVVLAATTLLECGDERACGALLPGIAAGDLTATVALTERRAEWDERDIMLQATRDGEGFVLSGTKGYVSDGYTASVLLVVARTDRGPSLFQVDGTAAGLTRTPLPVMDLTRKQARLSFAQTPGQLIGAEGQAWPVMERVLRRAAVLLAAEQVGGAQRCLDMAVEYAKMRVAFGRPIGSYQAIKHKCAEIVIELELARSAVIQACNALDTGDREEAALASLVKAMCSEIYLRASMDNIQIHAGIGYTWEHPAHLYLKRAKSDFLQLGDPIHHRKRVAAALAI